MKKIVFLALVLFLSFPAISFSRVNLKTTAGVSLNQKPEHKNVKALVKQKKSRSKKRIQKPKSNHRPAPKKKEGQKVIF
jgi:hypothetical protein